MLPLAANFPSAPAFAPSGDPSPSQTTLVLNMLELVAACVALKDYLAFLLVIIIAPAQCADRAIGSASASHRRRVDHATKAITVRTRCGSVSGRLQIAGEAQAVRFVRILAVLQGHEKITRGGRIVTSPLKLFDAFLLPANVIFKQFKLRVRLRNFPLKPHPASRLRAEQTSAPKASRSHRYLGAVARPQGFLLSSKPIAGADGNATKRFSHGPSCAARANASRRKK
jgi:hypothetical protein